MKHELKNVWEIVEKHPLFYLLLVSLLIRIFYLSLNHPLWWDAHIYIGMGKYIFSNRAVGIWESFRPLIHPIFLGFLWSNHLDPIIFGKILDLIISLADVLLVYLIGKKIFGQRTALLGALIFSLTPQFLMYTGMILTEPLALLFGLIGIYFIIKEKTKLNYFWAGLFLALSFLTKFPCGIFFGVVFMILLFKHEGILDKAKNISIYSLGFFLAVFPYLYFNYLRYPNLWEPFISGSEIVTTATWAYDTGISFYFVHFFLLNPIFLFSLVYFYYFLKEEHWKDQNKLILTLLPWAIFFYFFLLVPRKEVRYLTAALPFFSLAASYAILQIHTWFKSNPKPVLRPYAFTLICAIMIIPVIYTSLQFEKVPQFENEINTAVKEYNITGTIITSNPAFVSYLDNKLAILSGMEFAPTIYQKNRAQRQLVFINDCDLECAPEDEDCREKRTELLNLVFAENELIYQDHFKNCTYSMLLPKTSESLK